MALTLKKATKSAPVAAAKKVVKKAAKPATDGTATRNPQPKQDGKTSGLNVSGTINYLLDANSHAAGILKDKDRRHPGTNMPKGMVIGKPWTDEQIKAYLIAEFPGRNSKAFANVSSVRRAYNHNPETKVQSQAYAYDNGSVVALEPGRRVLTAKKAAPVVAKPAAPAAGAAKKAVPAPAVAKKVAKKAATK